MDCFHVAFIISVVTSVSYSYGLKVITASLGERATLPCELQDSATDNILSLYWRKDGNAVYSNTANGVGLDRYSVTDTSSLVIPNVSKSDAGNYSCKIVSRRTFQPSESDITQLYVTDIDVSYCQDTEDGECSCSINGSNITSLECSASGFPHPPVITWDVGHVTYRLSSLNLTSFTENVTIVCKANDVNIKSATETKTVCIYYLPEFLVKTVPSQLNAPVLLTCVILLLIVIIVMCIGAVYIYRKHSEVCRLRLPFNTTSKPPKNCDTAEDSPQRGQTSEDSESYHGLRDIGNKPKRSIVRAESSRDEQDEKDEPDSSATVGQHDYAHTPLLEHTPGYGDGSPIPDKLSLDVTTNKAEDIVLNDDVQSPGYGDGSPTPDKLSLDVTTNKAEDIVLNDNVQSPGYGDGSPTPDKLSLDVTTNKAEDIVLNDNVQSPEADQGFSKSSINAMGSCQEGEGIVLNDTLQNSNRSNEEYVIEKDDKNITAGEDEYNDMGHPDNFEEHPVMNEPPMPPVGYVLLDDLRSSPADRATIRGVIVALISKRKERYDGHIKPSDPIQTSFMRNTIVDDDTAFVHLILDDLDQIHDERDRDECEILITKPDIREITDESQIPTCQGNVFIQQSSLGNSYGSPSTQVSMTSSMTSGMMCNPLSKLLENELRKKPNERTRIRNDISQIILDCMKMDYSKRGNDYTLTRSTGGLRGTGLQPYVETEEQDDEISRLVTFWTTKTAKLGSEVNKHIKKYLFPLKPRNGNINESLGADSGILSSTERDDIPPTAMLLDSNC